LFRASVRGSYNEELKDRRGYLLLEIDGSHILLPPDDALREYYGATGHENSAATARASALYDMLTLFLPHLSFFSPPMSTLHQDTTRLSIFHFQFSVGGRACRYRR
jgi:hypothetical protein